MEDDIGCSVDDEICSEEEDCTEDDKNSEEDKNSLEELDGKSELDKILWLEEIGFSKESSEELDSKFSTEDEELFSGITSVASVPLSVSPQATIIDATAQAIENFLIMTTPSNNRPFYNLGI
ncbi:MAG: hypothetical protein MJY87_08170 [Fibrobacter sp.]|nr:hypothetical protein [Fibrobacter sp.]